MGNNEKKRIINSIGPGQLWASKSQGLLKGAVVEIKRRHGRGFWQTTRVDENAPSRKPTHLVRDWDLIKFYERIK